MSRYCSGCGKAKKACICAEVKPIEAKTEVIILQHPTEVKQAKGTAKILSLSLSNSRCFVGEDFTHHAQLNALLQQKNYTTLLLYPAEKAVEITALASQKETESERVRLIVIDGTWKKAFKIYTLSKNLHPLQACKLPPSLCGSYTIRKAPDNNSLSTVEAGYHALSLLEPEIDFQPLINAFDYMKQFYLEQVPAALVNKHYKLDK
ncbi:tRNA-uridine aminocarboxypropyltransferase [Vibrio sp. SCSIO 43137]|uniref:tRNA-uridine aminocarboxypropyltransferase n=1 Tax=Vibrio sp. SCSIO 43137 TaxID=3021011 RepID=UPI00230787CF|nr:tRNA-uridine aminocarboxypropyltransferase [Vibrio sp. SCSIO 43137]WCE30581.1 DTW domain-containing protein [Vibrio sp. SCSIO 43137]